MEEPFYICIGRQLGAGGLEIAGKLSAIFNIPVFDRELLIKASIESGISPEFFENEDEQPVRKSRAGLFGAFHLFSFGFGYDPSSDMLSHETLASIQNEVIRKAAAEGPAIFVGRCTDYLLREEKNAFSAFIVANDKDRVARLRKAVKTDIYRSMNDDEIVDYMHRADRRRAEYYNFHTYKTWGAAESYDICLSSSVFSTDKCAEIIAELAKSKFGR